MQPVWLYSLYTKYYNFTYILNVFDETDSSISTKLLLGGVLISAGGFIYYDMSKGINRKHGGLSMAVESQHDHSKCAPEVCPHNQCNEAYEDCTNNRYL